jgi:heptosyltransferase II
MNAAASLLVAPAWVGDAVMSEPLLRRIAATDQCPVDILAPPWVAPVFERMPGVGNIIPAPFTHGTLDIAARWRLGRLLKARKYHNAYVLPNSLKSALPVAFAGIPHRIGFTGECRYGVLNHRHVLDKQALPRMVDRFLALAPGHPPLQTLEATTPVLQVSSKSFDKVCTKLGLTRGHQLAVLCPGAEFGPAKRWPAAHFATLACSLAQDGYTVWTVGSSKDQAIGEAIAQQSEGLAINLCGRTELADAIDLLSGADIAITNDSGLMHVAAALARPLVALYGSSSPVFTPPLAKQVSILQHPVPCSPCFERTCRYGHLDCLNKLTPDTVMNAIKPPVLPHGAS